MSKSNSIVVISERDDGHIAFVQKHLSQPLVVLDRAEIVQKRAATYRLNKTLSECIVYDNGQELHDVTAVWYRKPALFEDIDLPVEPDLQQFTIFQLKEFTRLLYSRFSNARWISDYFAILRANDKLLQLEYANRLGFRVPETVITSSPSVAQAFVADHTSVIAKHVQVRQFVRGGTPRAFLTTKVTSATDFSGLHLAPAILQECVNVCLDIRVTVIGDKVFAASIDGLALQSTGEVRDWRLLNYDSQRNEKIALFTLPKEIERLCVQHVRALGLLFGAIDLVQDQEGQFWFLENNPNGQWAFVEETTGQPIGKAIAELLERPVR